MGEGNSEMEGEVPLSKNQQKRLLKQEAWAATLAVRKQQRKEKKLKQREARRPPRIAPGRGSYKRQNRLQPFGTRPICKQTFTTSLNPRTHVACMPNTATSII